MPLSAGHPGHKVTAQLLSVPSSSADGHRAEVHRGGSPVVHGGNQICYGQCPAHLFNLCSLSSHNRWVELHVLSLQACPVPGMLLQASGAVTHVLYGSHQSV